MFILADIIGTCFSFLWLSIAVIMFIFSVFADSSGFMAIPMAVFVVVGIFVFVNSLKNLIKKIKLNKVEKSGAEGIGVYSSFAPKKSSSNIIAYFYIIFKFKNNKGEEIEVKTQPKYTLEEANYYAYIKQFKIKYIGNTAVIAEPVDYNILQHVPNNKVNQMYVKPFDFNREKLEQEAINTYYICEYCGGTQKKPGKCSYCGANVHKKHK